MSPAYFQRLFAYNLDVNQRVWDCVMQLSDADYVRDVPYSIGSVEKQVAHYVGVEYWWLRFLATGELDFQEEPKANRAAQRAFWDEVNAANKAYIDGLTPEELTRYVKPEFWDDDTKSITVANAITHVMLHSMDHRSQILRALHDFGAPTIEQEYLYYLLDL